MFEDEVRELVTRALSEDRSAEDTTSDLLGDKSSRVVTGRFVAEKVLVVAGLSVVREVLRQVDQAVKYEVRVDEGESVTEGAILAVVEGPAKSLLAAERVALNFLQHLSGIATETKRAVAAVGELAAKITDTRKTLPGLRSLEKYAVRMGGGVNNRSSLADAVFIKDNHWALIRAAGTTLKHVLESVPDGISVVVEVDCEAELREALESGVGHVLVDNQDPETVSRWVEIAGPDVVIEASGGISLDRVRDYALAGARRISLGAITHSARAAPIGFELEV